MTATIRPDAIALRTKGSFIRMLRATVQSSRTLIQCRVLYLNFRTVNRAVVKLMVLKVALHIQEDAVEFGKLLLLCVWRQG